MPRLPTVVAVTAEPLAAAGRIATSRTRRCALVPLSFSFSFLTLPVASFPFALALAPRHERAQVVIPIEELLVDRAVLRDMLNCWLSRLQRMGMLGLDVLLPLAILPYLLCRGAPGTTWDYAA